MLISSQNTPDARERISLWSSLGLKPDYKEKSLQEEGNLPTKCEEQIICLFLRDRFNIKVNVRDIPNYINFNNIVKKDLMDVIYNYFFIVSKEDC